jgi:hypothetical protein
MYRLTRLALIALALLVLGSAGAWADDRTGGGSGSMSGPHHRPARPTPRPHPFFGCCLGGGYFPPAPPVVVSPPPTVYVVVPAPPSLVYVPTPRVEPAPEITLPTGRWARHGNGVDYPYTWVWVGPAPSR